MATQLDRTGGGESGPPRLLLLGLGAEVYAVALATVRVVLDAPVVTRLPDAPAALLGVTNVRGEVVGVVDTAAALGVGTLRGARFAAVVETAAGPVALACDEAPRATDGGEVVGAGDLPAATERRRVGDVAATVVDVDTLVAGVRRAAT